MTRVSSPEKAFTLIELVLVGAVLAILSSMVFRSMFVFNEQRKLRVAAVELSGYLQVARNVANARNAPCTIALSQANGGVFIPAAGAGNACQPGTIAPAVRLADLSGSSKLQAATLPGAGTYPLTFSPEGTVRQGATVLLSSADVPDGAWCVNVEAPLATVRLGWRQTGGSCDYTLEQ